MVSMEAFELASCRQTLEGNWNAFHLQRARPVNTMFINALKNALDS